jgi:pyruvate dehydrogenase E1 component
VTRRPSVGSARSSGGTPRSWSPTRTVPGLEVGGHIATYQSSASLYEVGFNHFFRGKDHPGGGDQIYIQGHASPGIYARAFLEGRLTEQQLSASARRSSTASARGCRRTPTRG